MPKRGLFEDSISPKNELLRQHPTLKYMLQHPLDFSFITT